MRTLVLLSLAFAVALAAPAEDVSTFIVGGQNAAPGQFPFMVSLQWQILTLTAHLCGGAIVSPSWVISAAHCKTESPDLGTIFILVGKHNLAVTEPTQVRHDILRYANHPGWVPGPQVGPDDITLVSLHEKEID